MYIHVSIILKLSNIAVNIVNNLRTYKFFYNYKFLN